MKKPKNTMSNELTELLQDKAKEQPKSERLFVRWLEEGESPHGYEQKPTGNKEQ